MTPSVLKQYVGETLRFKARICGFENTGSGKRLLLEDIVILVGRKRLKDPMAVTLSKRYAPLDLRIGDTVCFNARVSCRILWSGTPACPKDPTPSYRLGNISKLVKV